jgi:hypothetical protein
MGPDNDSRFETAGSKSTGSHQTRQEEDEFQKSSKRNQSSFGSKESHDNTFMIQ